MKEINNNDGLDFMNSMTKEELEKFINEVCEDLTPDFRDVRKINSYTYEFPIKQLIYRVEITESIFLDTKKKMISVKFKLINNPNQPKREDFDNDRQYQIALQKSQMGITGTGNPMAVFRKVIASIINSIKEIQPDYITFIADEKDRQGLYNKIIAFVRKYIPFQYKQLNYNPLDNMELEPGEFWLEIEK